MEESTGKGTECGCWLLRPEVNFSVGERNGSVFSTGIADGEQVGGWKAAVGCVILGCISLEASPQILELFLRYYL